jgi:hypothetical protein
LVPRFKEILPGEQWLNLALLVTKVILIPPKEVVDIGSFRIIEV